MSLFNNNDNNDTNNNDVNQGLSQLLRLLNTTVQTLADRVKKLEDQTREAPNPAPLATAGVRPLMSIITKYGTNSEGTAEEKGDGHILAEALHRYVQLKHHQLNWDRVPKSISCCTIESNCFSLFMASEILAMAE